jgi:type II secretory ATPase GspE/PulE/Tfp pilus assembly ATPase PilB-like protein
MVGEIRDTETAEIAVRASLTGHLVLSTLHTNDAASAMTRLLDMGLEPFLISSSVTLIMAQRLVRKICPHCRVETGISAEALQEAHMDLVSLLGRQGEEVRLYKGRGCPECAHTGYKGRIGIFEVMPVSGTVGEMIVRRATAQEIREQAIKEGMFTLRHDALLKVKGGVTTLEEVLRETSA